MDYTVKTIVRAIQLIVLFLEFKKLEEIGVSNIRVKNDILICISF